MYLLLLNNNKKHLKSYKKVKTLKNVTFNNYY